MERTHVQHVQGMVIGHFGQSATVVEVETRESIWFQNSSAESESIFDAIAPVSENDHLSACAVMATALII